MKPFIYSDQKYSCLACGKSCNNSYTISLTPEKVETISRLYQFDEQEKSNHFNSLPIIQQDGSELYSLAKKGHACTFLRSDNKCSIHADHGAQNKPEGCQVYPFMFTETPIGVFVSVSFACTSSIRQDGTPLKEQADTIEKLYEKEINHRVLTQKLLRNPSTKLSWDEYLKLEKLLLEDLSSKGLFVSLLTHLKQELATDNSLADILYTLSSFIPHYLHLFESSAQNPQESPQLTELPFQEPTVSRRTGVLMPVPLLQYPEPIFRLVDETFKHYFRTLIINKYLIQQDFRSGLLVANIAYQLALYYTWFFLAESDSEQLSEDQLYDIYYLLESNLYYHENRNMTAFNQTVVTFFLQALALEE